MQQNIDQSVTKIWQDFIKVNQKYSRQKPPAVDFKEVVAFFKNYAATY